MGLKNGKKAKYTVATTPLPSQRIRSIPYSPTSTILGTPKISHFFLLNTEARARVKTLMIEVVSNSPLADSLNSVIQPKLIEVGWSTGGGDDSALSEYIVMMLVNGKTQEQIASELSNDLLNLGPDDSLALDFSRWLFEQIRTLHDQANAASNSQQMEVDASLPVSGPPPTRQESNQPGVIAAKATQDSDMSDSLESNLPVPTGPKSMRKTVRNISAGGSGNKRLFGHLSKAMDRSHDSILHKVRPHHGTERINIHAREPPKGPKASFGNHNMGVNRMHQRPAIARPSTAQSPFGHGLGGLSGSAMAIQAMTPQQQMQLYAMYEEQARMMSAILGPQKMPNLHHNQHQHQVPLQHPPGFMPGTGSAPGMQGHPYGFSRQHQQHQQHQQLQPPGRSLFDRVQENPQRQNGAHPRLFGNSPKAGSTTQYSQSMEVDGDSEQAARSKEGENESLMEIEPSSQAGSDMLSMDDVCKFNLGCTKKDCPYAHQSPAAPLGITIDVSDHCPFGVACKNKKCVARHPSPAQKINHQAEQDCRFYPNCSNSACPFRHPTMPICRNGADCTRTNCIFAHIKTLCKYNPCMNIACSFKHSLGQKRGAYDDKVWTADSSGSGPRFESGFAKQPRHVSERKFVSDNNGEEELIVPGGVPKNTATSQPSSPALTAEIVT
ncbi:MAG: hypothetical protein M1829_004621 [Trizodia sp. TS-e1964]|nr:MAG: hypothetical protein M1829_004621 [Trizodia sp. TS-e1964]